MKCYEKIVYYLKNYDESFTAKMIAIKIGLPYNTIKNNFQVLVNKGEIFQIDCKDHAKIYITRLKADTLNSQSFTSFYNKILDFISNNNESFTIKELASKLGISYGMASSYIIKLATEDKIIQIEDKRHSKIFISKSKADAFNCKAFSSHYQKVKNFLYDYNESFTTWNIANKLGITYDVAKRELRRLASEGEIIQIEIYKCPKVFITKSRIDTFNNSRAKTIYEKIKDFVDTTSEPFSAKTLAIEFGLSLLKIWRILTKLLKYSHIEHIGFDMRIKIFISKKSQETNLPIYFSEMGTYDRIMSFIKNLNEPFTAKHIAVELGLGIDAVKTHLSKMLTNGYIKLVRTVIKAHIYVSSDFLGKLPLLNSEDKIKNFIYYSGLPFTMRRVADETGTNYSLVRYYIPRLIKAGYIKMIGKDGCKKVFVFNRYYQEKNKAYKD